MLSDVFYKHGRMCASCPWKVIITFLTLIALKIYVGNTQVDNSKICDDEWSEENKGVEMVFHIIFSCLAILYCTHQFLKLNKLGSTFLATGGIYTFLCFVVCFVFNTNIANFMKGDFSELQRAWPFYFLLMNIAKARLLARFALSSSTQEEVREKIAKEMSILGPTITLDTVVKTLVIGVGTLSGMKELEELCSFACLSAVINYFVFLTFFPACLSLIFELARDNEGRPIWHLSPLTKILQQNPVLQRVKAIMSAGLVLVHLHSHWPLKTLIVEAVVHYWSLASKALQHANKDNQSYSISHVQKWFGSAEQMIMVAFACTFAVMYHYLESREDLGEYLASAAIWLQQHLVSSPSRCPIGYQSSFSSQTVQTSSCEADELCKKSKESVEKHVQTDLEEVLQPGDELDPLQSEAEGAALTDEEVIILAEKKIISFHELERIVQNPKRSVVLHRKLLAKRGQILKSLPYDHYDYEQVIGSCCENVIGYVPIPVGVAGPLLLDGEKIPVVPMATTEGCLVASTNRGCKALARSGGVRSCLLSDGMTRGAVIRLPSEIEACEIKIWVEKQKNFEVLKTAFDSTSRFAKLQSIKVRIAGRFAFLRFKALTGDAMGMNMLSKGSEEALNKLREIFSSVKIISLSGNYCTDKKPAALNWIQGRGKEVVCGATIPAKVLKEVLKTDVATLVELNISKNYIGSALAGSIGGFNAQAANIVTAIYLATGQDPAQNVTSSNCLTQIEATEPDGDLYISCTMPSIEVGTVGGGTFLPAQSSCLEMMGVKGPCEENPGRNASKLARIVCATVLAGELSLLSAQANGDLVRSHMAHNRSSASIQSSATRPSLDNVLVNVNPLT